jgi:hypothetical protein
MEELLYKVFHASIIKCYHFNFIGFPMPVGGTARITQGEFPFLGLLVMMDT